MAANNELERWDYSGNDSPRCPHCTEVIDIDEHGMYELYSYDEDDMDIVCPMCDKGFNVAINKKITFDTDHNFDDE